MAEISNKKAQEYQLALESIKRSVERLHQAVVDGTFSSRSIVGDEVLNMKEELEDVGMWNEGG